MHGKKPYPELIPETRETKKEKKKLGTKSWNSQPLIMKKKKEGRYYLPDLDCFYSVV
jgi:hypothetical protein